MIFQQNKRIATVALNLRPRRGPFGGGNQWAGQISAYLRRCGYRVVYRLDERVDLVMGTHTGLSDGLEFSYEEVAEAKLRNPRLRCLQRINDNDIRKGTDAMDAVLAAANRAADHTVFVSAWLRDYHGERWFDRGRPHSVIRNGADPAVFHPFGNKPWHEREMFRIVTHHWSDNPAKGFDVYERIDTLIAEEKLPGVELWIIGRWPTRIQWKAARTFEACSGHRLAGLLRQCHAAVSASKFEPGAMHPVEALQCGLPLLYTPDTGGTVDWGEKFGICADDDLVAAIGRLKSEYAGLREKLLRDGPAGDRMCLEYRQLIQSVLAMRL